MSEDSQRAQKRLKRDDTDVPADPGISEHRSAHFSPDAAAQPQAIIRHNLVRNFYSLTEQELEGLARSSRLDWRDPFLVSISICLATGLNAFAEAGNHQATVAISLTAPVFVNSVLAVASLILSLVFGLLWWKGRTERRQLLASIRGRPDLLFDESTLRSPIQPTGEAPYPKEPARYDPPYPPPAKVAS